LRRGDDPDKGKSSRCYRDSKGRWLIMRKSKPSLFLIPVESITDINSLKTGLLSWSVAQLFVDRIFVGGFVYASFPEDPWSLNKWSQENRRRIFIQGREYGICVDSLIRPNEVCRPPIAVIESDLLVESLFDFPIPDFHWKKWPKAKISSSTMPEDYSEELEVQIQKLRKLDAKFKGRFK
ncbi:MAG: hypothetical protein KDD25_02905, partial [Bdellovibrionales bacterium]|nr:hypothetical protein [Bdellovibrionales bacterium]